MPHTKKRCCCRICQSKLDPIDARTVTAHLKKYGSSEPVSSPSKSEIEESARFSSDETDNEEIPVLHKPALVDLDTSEIERTNVIEDHPEADSSLLQSDNSDIDDQESQSDIDSTSSDASLSDADENSQNNNDEWSLSFDNQLYANGIATQNLPNSNITVLQWLAVNFYTFSSHAMSKSSFSSYLKIQKVLHTSSDETKDIVHLPSNYKEARRLLTLVMLNCSIWRYTQC